MDGPPGIQRIKNWEKKDNNFIGYGFRDRISQVWWHMPIIPRGSRIANLRPTCATQ
jgi:hypothetical protein